jgi:tight adherence protein C
MISPIELVVEIFTFAVVVAITWAIIGAAASVVNVRRRLGADVAAAPTAGRGSLIKAEGVSNPFLQWVQSSSSLNDTADRLKLQRSLLMAGFESASAPVWYVILRFSCAIGLPLAFIGYQAFSAHPTTGIPLIFGALLLCGFGLIVPRALVDRRARQRAEEMEREFPDVLDLTVVCVEAGLGLEAAFIRVGHEVRESHRLMSEAFERVSQEMRAGRSRADALRAMADRVQVDTIKSFVALLIQTDALGTSIAQTLRSYSVEMREHRFLRAEEKAMRIPVLMTLPLVACILPTIIGALLLPPILDVVRTVGPAMARHH